MRVKKKYGSIGHTALSNVGGEHPKEHGTGLYHKGSSRAARKHKRGRA